MLETPVLGGFSCFFCSHRRFHVLVKWQQNHDFAVTKGHLRPLRCSFCANSSTFWGYCETNWNRFLWFTPRRFQPASPAVAAVRHRHIHAFRKGRRWLGHRGQAWQTSGNRLSNTSQMQRSDLLARRSSRASWARDTRAARVHNARHRDSCLLRCRWWVAPFRDTFHGIPSA